MTDTLDAIARERARLVCQAYARNSGNDFKEHFDTVAAVQWMQQALAEADAALSNQGEGDKPASIWPDFPNRKNAQEHFGEYFRLNYPGPYTIISDPNWHAPRIFRAACYALRAAEVDAATQEQT